MSDSFTLLLQPGQRQALSPPEMQPPYAIPGYGTKTIPSLLKIRVHVRAKNMLVQLSFKHTCCQKYHRLVEMTINYYHNDKIIYSGMILVVTINHCAGVAASSFPVCLARAAPNLLICFSTSSSQPPRVSTTRGTKALLQASTCLVIFSLNLVVRAWPGRAAA
jgi:hypothetical protein